MKYCFSPQKLNIALAEVSKQHPSKSTPPQYEGDQEFIKMLKYWAYLPIDEVEQEAMMIPPRRVRQLVEYVSSNIYKLPMRNLAHIIRLRADDTIFLRLFSLWLDAYENKDFSRLLKVVSRAFVGRPQNVFHNSQLIIPIFSEWVESDNVPVMVGKTCMRHKVQAGGFENALRAYSVSTESSLGKACIDSFYTFCAKDDYSAICDSDMERVLRRYDEKQIHAFMRNFLSVMDVPDFQKFYLSGKFLLQKYTNSPGTKPFQSFFSTYPSELIEKYQRWLNYITIRDSFHNNTNDVRMIFWNKYVPNMHVAYLERVSEALIMKFDDYGVIEFTEATMGPLYVYEIDDFEKRIVPRSRTHTNQEFRHYLYNNAYIQRIPHQGNWQYRTRRYLQRNQITR